MRFGTYFGIGLAAALVGAAPGDSQGAEPVSYTYADLADLAAAAPVAAHVRIKDASPLKGPQAAAVPPGRTRFFIEAEVISVLSGAQGLPVEVRYLADLPNDPRGRAPKPRKKSEFLLLGATVPGRPGELRLVTADAHLPFTPARADQIRAIRREASAAGAPPRITGIGKAFHVPGTLPGESETQIFFQTADGRPVSLNVLRRPGQTPQWAVALSEVIDEAASAPRPDTLLWYRLACTLPPALPAHSVSEAEPGHVAAIQSDYRYVLSQLGRCTRTRRG